MQASMQAIADFQQSFKEHLQKQQVGSHSSLLEQISQTQTLPSQHGSFPSYQEDLKQAFSQYTIRVKNVFKERKATDFVKLIHKTLSVEQKQDFRLAQATPMTPIDHDNCAIALEHILSSNLASEMGQGLFYRSPPETLIPNDFPEESVEKVRIVTACTALHNKVAQTVLNPQQ